MFANVVYIKFIIYERVNIMKAQRFFSGNDTFGHSIEMAQSKSGKWYSREYGFNGYGKAWSKWAAYDEEVTFETHGVNQYSGESFEYEKPVLMWGFNKMVEYEEIPRVKLPA